ncbi:VOC family protein [Phytoactinopolyspora halotolerans]|uniref:4a-hydroxytetrahydrobiopterin dehydratase n=1 Tax=Phytoactinopolyspora halotolerans TaxID=1981512 RepID=A0A6L9SF20_9ACTN|nr:VOC family protein [Phytoactinopolyspora halotolerans]NEE03052.1 4a-hydroxytetrahydrobiopterin dehydratase [Phytoactinopolyspora halotolerans]
MTTAGSGWRYVHGALGTSVRVTSMAQGADVVKRAVEACGDDVDEHLSVEMQRKKVTMTLQSARSASVTHRDHELAALISVSLGDRLMWATGVRHGPPHSRQVMEVIIPTRDPSVREFWEIATGYDRERGSADPEDPLVDPLCQGPTIYFRKFDDRDGGPPVCVNINVGRDEAQRRIQALRDFGARVVADCPQELHTVFADAAGNEVRIVPLHP